MADDKIKLRELLQGKEKIGHATGDLGKVSIVEMKPMPRTKSLLVSAQVAGTKLYSSQIAFYGMSYTDKKDKTHVLEVDTGSEKMFCEQLNLDQFVQVRCTCPDFYFTYAYPTTQHKALLGAPFPTYVPKTPEPGKKPRPARNPANIPGLCKHLNGVVMKLAEAKILDGAK